MVKKLSCLIQIKIKCRIGYEGVINMSKYVCPICRGKLKFWQEYIFNRERLVNIYTGKLNKKSFKSNSTKS